MHARGLFIRGSGAVVLSLLAFYGCGGLNEANVYLDGSVLRADAGPNGICGDGKISGTEDCDGALFGGQTCKTVTMNPASLGSLGCTSECKFDLSHCTGRSGTGGTGGTDGSGGTSGAGGISGLGGVVGTGGRTAGQGGTTGAAGSGNEAVQCTSDSACPRNRVCCGTEANGQLTGFQCAASCGRNEVPAACGKAADCARGQVCCGTLTANQTQYTGLACAATCTGRNDITLCTANAECAQGTRCQVSQLLPSGFKVCR